MFAAALSIIMLKLAYAGWIETPPLPSARSVLTHTLTLTFGLLSGIFGVHLLK